jgi:hypothetical protein
MGIMHGSKTVGASHEPSLDPDLDPGGESKSRSMIKSKTTRCMGMMHDRKAVDASHEPLLVRSTGFSLPRHRPNSAQPTDRINPALRTSAPWFIGIVHDQRPWTLPMNLHPPGAPASLPARVFLDAVLVPAGMPALPGFNMHFKKDLAASLDTRRNERQNFRFSHDCASRRVGQS